MQGDLEKIETKMTLSWPQAAPVVDGFVSWHAQEVVQTHALRMKPLHLFKARVNDA